MYYGMIITARLMKELPESELDSFVADLNSFKKHARVCGKLRGMPNYIFNIYDETDFNEASNKFCGNLRLYIETETRDNDLIEDVRLICDHYEAVITQLVRKLII